jgi:transposase InsO family protein
VSRFRFVADHRDTYEVKRLCKLVEVSRSGFYAWASRAPSKRDVDNASVLEAIVDIHTRSRGTYGAPRVTGQLRRAGHCVNHKRVARLMAANGLVGVTNRRKWRRDDDHKGPLAPDLIGRDFTAEAPDQRWVADITEFDCGDGRLYLAAIMDLFSRRIVGWSIGPRRPAELVVDALVMAIGRREPPDGVVHHADHGSQYTSIAFSDAAHDRQVAMSFGRVGSCFDNAAMEAFWSTLKRELAHIHRRDRWEHRDDLRRALFDYIEVFYNRQRHQAGLDHLTPADYEAAATPAA